MTIKENIKSNPPEHKRLVNDNTKPRLFFFAVDEKQRDVVWDIAPKFLSKGMYVANVILSSGKRPSDTEVRYFRSEDKSEAEKIDSILGELGISDHRPSRVNDEDSVGTGRKYQIWLRNEDFRKAP
jgi:hypothetical protein